MSTILVTGVNGFVGKHLVRELKTRKHRVIGIGHKSVDLDNKVLLDGYESCDLTDAREVKKLELQGVDAVIGLAGLVAKGRGSFGADAAYNKANVDMLCLLGERLLEIGSTARVIAVSTGLVYDSKQPLPYTETFKTTQEGSPYVLSKLAMEEAADKLKVAGLDCVITRPFNHSGPGQTGGYLIPDAYNKLIAFKQNGTPVPVSPKKTKRDYTDVRDVVKAYADLAMADKLEFAIYNICAGKSRSAEEILHMMQEAMGLDNVPTKINESFARPNDPADLYGTYERLHQETGWQPTIPFEQTIKDFVLSQKA